MIEEVTATMQVVLVYYMQLLSNLIISGAMEAFVTRVKQTTTTATKKVELDVEDGCCNGAGEETTEGIDKEEESVTFTDVTSCPYKSLLHNGTLKSIKKSKVQVPYTRYVQSL